MANLYNTLYLIGLLKEYNMPKKGGKKKGGQVIVAVGDSNANANANVQQQPKQQQQKQDAPVNNAHKKQEESKGQEF